MSPEDVYRAIDHLVGFILRYAVTLAAVSALSMALIELFKALAKWRDRFHKQRVRVWVRKAAVPRDAFDRIQESAPGEDEFHKRIYDQLLRLTTGEAHDVASMERPIEWTPWSVSPGNALFALPLDKMMGQIQDAADAAMGNPSLYPEFYLFLTAGSRLDDITAWYHWATEPPVRSPEDAALAKKQADTYARLRQFIRRRLDAFQITAGYCWETGNQFASVLLGAVLLFVTLVTLAIPKAPQTALGWLGLFFLSIMGGIMAPVAKDLVIALKRMRSGG